jgi:hypothetical protein
MDIRSRGKRLATGVSAAVSLGSLAVAGIGSAAVYAATPTGTTTTIPSSTPGQANNPGQGTGGTTADNGSTGDSGSSPYNGYSGVSPVQPGGGGSIQGRSSGS